MKVAVVLPKFDNDEQLFSAEIMRRYGDIQLVMFEKEGFLPDGLTSPVLSFLYGDKKLYPERRPIAFRNLNLPKEYEIVESKGWQIYDGIELKGKINLKYPFPDNSLTVDSIDWYGSENELFRKDIYNQYGYHYSSIIHSSDGKKLIQSFYDLEMNEKIVHFFENDVYCIKDGNKEHNIKGTVEFEKYMIARECQCDEIIFADSEMLGRINVANNPVESDGKKVTKKILILTRTDRIEGLEKLITELPEFEFNIGANTQVSDKLSDLEKYSNAHIYPQISIADRQRLMHECSFLLDITYGSEIFSATYTAAVSGLLIMGYDSTVNRSELMNSDCIIEGNNSERMKELLNTMTMDENIYIEAVKKQKDMVEQCLANERLF